MAFGPDDRLYVMVGNFQDDGQLLNDRSAAPPNDIGVIFRITTGGDSVPGQSVSSIPTTPAIR